MVALDGGEQGQPLVPRDEEPLFDQIHELGGVGRCIIDVGAMQLLLQGFGQGARDARTQGRAVHELANQRAAELGAGRALGRVVEVHGAVGAAPNHVVGERRGHLGDGLGDLDYTLAQLGQAVAQAVQIEVVVQAAAPGLDENGEILVAAHGLDELLGAQTIEPQRHATLEALARQEQGAGGVLAEASPEEARRFELAAQQGLDLFDGDEVEEVVDRERDGQRQAQAFVVGHDLEPGAVPLFPGGADADGQRSQDAAAPLGMENHPLGVEAVRRIVVMLDQNMVTVRQDRARGVELLAQMQHQLVQRGLVEVAAARHLGWPGRVLEARGRLFEEEANLLAQRPVPVDGLAAPEGGHAQLRSADHQHVLMGDAGDLPRLRTDRELVADAALPDELLVELTDECPALL